MPQKHWLWRLAIAAAIPIPFGALILWIEFVRARQFGLVGLTGHLGWLLSFAVDRQAAGELAAILLCTLAYALCVWIAYHAVTYHYTPKYEAGQCRGCGYDLTGNQSGVCPECGRPTKRERAVRLPW